MSGIGKTATKSEGLTVELVPASSWGNNLRSRLTRKDWDILRKRQYRKAGYLCEVCGAKGRLECHEVWEYDDERHVQKLVRLVALCMACHQVKHIGRISAVEGVVGVTRCLRHLMQVNGWDEKDTQIYIVSTFKRHAQRSKVPWTLDLSWLESVGISPPEL